MVWFELLIVTQILVGNVLGVVECQGEGCFWELNVDGEVDCFAAGVAEVSREADGEG